MITGHFPVAQLNAIPTPFYYYDMDILRETLHVLTHEVTEPNWHVHYAVKACATEAILRTIANSGVGADCVSGGEVKAAIEAGFPTDKIVFAGVAKTDDEIRYALTQHIFCFNVESTEELTVINDIAHELNLPIFRIGVGEGKDDLQAFDALAFCRALVGEEGMV